MFVIILISVGVAFLFFLCAIKGKPLLFTVIIVLAFVSIFTTHNVSTELPPSTIVFFPDFTKDKNSATIIPEGGRFWRWHRKIAGRQIASYARQSVAVPMKLSPITDNPKIRNLTYIVTVEAYGSPDLFRQTYGVTGPEGISTWLKRQLYEFNEKHSRDLAVFYNPLDSAQQATFSDLILRFLQPELERAGLNFCDAKFSLD